MKKALVQGDRIVQIADQEFPVHADLKWIDVPDDTTTRDKFTNQVIKEAPVPPVVERDIVDVISALAPQRLAALKTLLSGGKP